MSTIIENFNKIKFNILSVKPAQNVNIIAVSKTFPLEYIDPLIRHGHQHFGENKVQEAVAKYQISLKKNLNYFIQVDIGNEKQKSGITIGELDPFYNYCKNEINLNVLGLMIIPPNDNNPGKYFDYLNKLNKSFALQDLSMGMSADYIEAVKRGATFIRVGSSIFGDRS